MPAHSPSPAPDAPAAEAPPARERLLHAALQLFAEHGYAKTSIRAIAQAAQANVAAVSYYFGDKATLYAALFSESFGDVQPLVDAFSSERLSLREAMACYFGGMLEPLQHGERARQFILEPTSQWEREVQASVRVPHEALVRLLARHLNLATSDDGLERLAFSISGLAMQIWCQQDVLIALRPQLLDAPDALQAWVHRLTAYALALVAAEAALRGVAPPSM